MAVGDNFSIIMAVGGANRQPASGVVERITSAGLSGTTDIIASTDGSSEVAMHAGIAPRESMDWRITNACYATKTGTSNVGAICGVQVDA
jgi:hypothetical protein